MSQLNGANGLPDNKPNVLLGYGSPRPQPRMINNSMFGHVSDDYEVKTLKIGERPITNTKGGDKTSENNNKSLPLSPVTTPVKEKPASAADNVKTAVDPKIEALTADLTINTVRTEPR